jgi:hypothetical protein
MRLVVMTMTIEQCDVGTFISRHGKKVGEKGKGVANHPNIEDGCRWMLAQGSHAHSLPHSLPHNRRRPRTGAGSPGPSCPFLCAIQDALANVTVK